ncbi:NUDIX domain-containing protein [Streptomyces albidocamelliae]|uniref:NUDIX domain-containing protein n=1 Tax=Streptomyces albidocamelliae TaxID=2981135 RepID=A0ABY6F008_9ACTN|nr:NUDIX domain-containing protein [Streptomyces sp. HUAS 14-6]
MPLARSHIRRTSEAYLTRHPHERDSLAGPTSLLDGADDPADRATLPGHVTCSAAVIDRERRVLHIGHRGTGLLLAPGGHIEGDRTLLAAALREVCEETGLRPGDLCLTPQFPALSAADALATSVEFTQPGHAAVDVTRMSWRQADRPYLTRAAALLRLRGAPRRQARANCQPPGLRQPVDDQGAQMPVRKRAFATAFLAAIAFTALAPQVLAALPATSKASFHHCRREGALFTSCGSGSASVTRPRWVIGWGDSPGWLGSRP